MSVDHSGRHPIREGHIFFVPFSTAVGKGVGVRKQKPPFCCRTGLRHTQIVCQILEAEVVDAIHISGIKIHLAHVGTAIGVADLLLLFRIGRGVEAKEKQTTGDQGHDKQHHPKHRQSAKEHLPVPLSAPSGLLFAHHPLHLSRTSSLGSRSRSLPLIRLVLPFGHGMPPVLLVHRLPVHRTLLIRRTLISCTSL